MGDVDRESGSFQRLANARPFGNLVQLDVRSRANRIGKRFPLNILLDIEHDSIEITINLRLVRRAIEKVYANLPKLIVRLRLRLKYCYVRYHSKKIEIVPDWMYRRSVLNGSIEIDTSTNVTKKSNSELSVGLGASVSMGSTGPDGKVAAEGRTGVMRSAGVTAVQKITSTPAIYLVQVVPNGWRVGDPERGDPYNEGPLDGRYFEPSESAPSHTCEAEFKTGCDRAEITFWVEAHDGLLVDRTDGTEIAADVRRDAISAMRNKLAAIRVEKRIAPDGGAIALQTQTYEVVRAADDEAPIAVSLQTESSGDAQDAQPLPRAGSPRRRRR